MNYGILNVERIQTAPVEFKDSRIPLEQIILDLQ